MSHRFPRTTLAAYYCLGLAGLLLLVHEVRPHTYGEHDTDRFGWLAFLVAGVLCLLPRYAFPALVKFFDVVSAWWGGRKSEAAPPPPGDGPA